MWTSNSMTMGEVLLASAMGFMIVFLVLLFLALVITLFAKILSKADGAKKKAAPAAAPAAPAVPEKDDSEIVAIVTSVICEELGAQPSELCISGIREV